MSKAYKKASGNFPEDLLRTYLETGLDLFFEFTDKHSDPDPKWRSRSLPEIRKLWRTRPKPAIRELWQRFRAPLMKAWFADLEHPLGSRPWAFWAFDLPSGTARRFRPGKFLARDQCGVYVDREQMEWRAGAGLANVPINSELEQHFERHCAFWDPADRGWVENELELLTRLGLLTGREKKFVEQNKEKP